MKLEISDSAMQRVFALFTALGMLAPIVFVFASILFYDNSYERCLEDCREKYKFNVDNCWTACDDRCKEKFGK